MKKLALARKYAFYHQLAFPTLCAYSKSTVALNLVSTFLYISWYESIVDNCVSKGIVLRFSLIKRGNAYNKNTI